jgi:hypothetical protein
MQQACGHYNPPRPKWELLPTAQRQDRDPVYIQPTRQFATTPRLVPPSTYWCATEVETVSVSVSMVKNDVPPVTMMMFSFTVAPLNL